jgi:hypothetical protein
MDKAMKKPMVRPRHSLSFLQEGLPGENKW